MSPFSDAEASYPASNQSGITPKRNRGEVMPENGLKVSICRHLAKLDSCVRMLISMEKVTQQTPVAGI